MLIKTGMRFSDTRALKQSAELLHFICARQALKTGKTLPMHCFALTKPQPRDFLSPEALYFLVGGDYSPNSELWFLE